jgi:hypothetical protein
MICPVFNVTVFPANPSCVWFEGSLDSASPAAQMRSWWHWCGAADAVFVLGFDGWGGVGYDLFWSWSIFLSLMIFDMTGLKGHAGGSVHTDGACMSAT